MNKSLLDKIGKKRLRATFAGGPASGGGSPRIGAVDEAAGILSGVQICLEGEARGHGVWLGAPFIAALAAQGAALENGVKVRFGHPSMCADALGTFLGRAVNFRAAEVTRADGTTCQGVFADIKLADEAHNGPGGRDIYAWVLAAAKNNPDTFGQSIVFTYADFYVTDSAGADHLFSQEPGGDKDKWLEKSADGRVYAVLDKLHGADFTDDPAATDGVFSQFDSADLDTLAQEAEELLDAHPRILAALTGRPDTVAEFIDRYNAALLADGKPAVRLGAADETVEARLAALQSAKDKEISALRTDFEAQTKKLTGDLDAAKSALSSAEAERDALAATLAQTGEQLAQERANLAKVTGGALTHTEAGSALSWDAAREKFGYAEARKKYPEAFAKRFGLKA